MELYNKYLPQTIDDYYLHPELQEFLKNLKNKDLPNIILYGQAGSGKKSFLSILFPGKKIKTIKTIKSNSKAIEYTIYHNNLTIEIDSKELRIYNKYLLQKVIKNIAETKRVNDNKSKIIIIHNAHYLDKEFQYILRKMIELYMSNAVFILVTTSLSKIINPVKSRCLCIRINNPTNGEIKEFLEKIIEKEGISITENKFNQILNNNMDRNLKKAVLDLEVMTYQNGNMMDTKIANDIKKIVSTLNNKNFNPTLINNWETKLYNLIINFSIEDKTILKLLFNEIIPLIKDTDVEKKKKVLEITCEFDERMTKGSKSIIHLNNYLTLIYDLLR